MLLMLVASAWEGVHSHLLACALWIKKFLNKSGIKSFSRLMILLGVKNYRIDGLFEAKFLS